MQTFLSTHWLDMLTTILGLFYIWFEYRASIALWVIGIVLPALDIILYWQHGLYGDAGMAIYYTLAALYGYCVWKWGKNGKHEKPINHLPRRYYLPIAAGFLLAWAATYYVLTTWTDSTVPVLDSFTNALSIVGMWALAHKYVEHWLFWIVVEVVSSILYAQKGLPFKSGLYGLYFIIATLGYFKWKRLMTPSSSPQETTPPIP